jgi:hypothetical protein
MQHVIVVPENESQTEFTIRDEAGYFLADSSSLADAVKKAVQIADEAGLDRFTVLLSQHA